jgi:hypothetical protein
LGHGIALGFDLHGVWFACLPFHYSTLIFFLVFGRGPSSRLGRIVRLFFVLLFVVVKDELLTLLVISYPARYV